MRLKRLWVRGKHRIITLFRNGGDPHAVARGVCLGLCVALFIPIGLHTIAVLSLGFVFRCSKVVALAVTFSVANELTIPILYPVQCYVGSRLIGTPLDWAEVKHSLSIIHDGFSRTNLEFLISEYGYSFWAGGTLFALLTVPAAYYFSLRFAQKVQMDLRRRKLAREVMRRTSTVSPHVGMGEKNFEESAKKRER